jgi:lipid-A-disaccharide synthase
MIEGQTKGALQPADRDRAIVLVAGEESGDQLGAALMRALKKRTGGRVRFAGVGGREMAAEGLASLFPIDDLAIIGFAAIPRQLPLIVRRIRETARLVTTTRPDALVIIDSPDFTHRVARRVRAAAPFIPILDYVSPSVWAWRPGRAHAMRSYVDHVLALLPFEPRAHQRLGGPPCSYVGHPLLERLDQLRPSALEAERRLAEPPILLVLPGSRSAEIRRLTAVFGQALGLLATGRLAAGRAPPEIVLPTLPHLHERITAATADWPLRPRIVVESKDKEAAFRVARAALAKSGTVTLELALAGIPMVTAYKVSWVEEIVARLAVNAPSAILPNLILEENVVPEFLQRRSTPQNLADALAPLLTQSPQRRRQIDSFTRLDAIMRLDTVKRLEASNDRGAESPSGRAADIVLELARPPATEKANG